MRKAFGGAVGVIGLVVIAGFSSYAIAAPNGPTKRTFTATVVGARIRVNGGSAEEVFKVASSLNGTCAGIAEDSNPGTRFPLPGTDAVTYYCANGVSKEKSKYVLNAPDANGVITYTGSGKCVGGTGVHKQEKCTYTFKGTYNPKTNIDSAKFTGTDSR